MPMKSGAELDGSAVVFLIGASQLSSSEALEAPILAEAAAERAPAPARDDAGCNRDSEGDQREGDQPEQYR